MPAPEQHMALKPGCRASAERLHYTETNTFSDAGEQATHRIIEQTKQTLVDSIQTENR